jgi:hypothetical protein
VVKLKVVPTHNGLLAVAVGAAGIGLTTTFNVPVELVQPNTDTVNEYVPVSNKLTPLMLGFCKFDVKLFGPLQL